MPSIKEPIPEYDVEQIFDHHFRCLITGASDTGKSFFMTQVLFPYLKDKFDRVIIFTRETNVPYYEHNTKDFAARKENKSFGQRVKEWFTGEEENERFVHTVTDLREIPSILSSIPQEQEKVGATADGTPRYRYDYLVVFDDIMNEKLMKSQMITDLFTHYRHYQVSVFFVAQASNRYVPAIVKNNSSVVVITSMEDRDMRNDLLRHHVYACIDSIDYSDDQVRTKARNAYKFAIEDKKEAGFPYGVMVVDLKHRQLYYYAQRL